MFRYRCFYLSVYFCACLPVWFPRLVIFVAFDLTILYCFRLSVCVCLLVCLTVCLSVTGVRYVRMFSFESFGHFLSIFASPQSHCFALRWKRTESIGYIRCLKKLEILSSSTHEKWWTSFTLRKEDTWWYHPHTSKIKLGNSWWEYSLKSPQKQCKHPSTYLGTWRWPTVPKSMFSSLLFAYFCRFLNQEHSTGSKIFCCFPQCRTPVCVLSVTVKSAGGLQKTSRLSMSKITKCYCQ